MNEYVSHYDFKFNPKDKILFMRMKLMELQDTNQKIQSNFETLEEAMFANFWNKNIDKINEEEEQE